ncbi:MAG: tRNA pseudouridine(38-40) synthase TruA [Chitinophagaceae bacterium]
MPRYFIEVAYNGKNYAGFQVQQNANTIQSEIEKAFEIFFYQRIELTGSSRTDAGVHALQNFYHLDTNIALQHKHIYNLNAILPQDIVIKNIYSVAIDAHCRFLANYRSYEYFIYQTKNPFLRETAWHFPFTINFDVLQQAAAALKKYKDFTTFSKKHTQVNNFNCEILHSQWVQQNNCLVYQVKANRFLRGMVKGLVGTMLQVGRENLSLDRFKEIIEAKNCNLANFTPPSHGLFLVEVNYPDGVLDTPIA